MKIGSKNENGEEWFCMRDCPEYEKYYKICVTGHPQCDKLKNHKE